MSLWELPTSLEISGVVFKIRYQYTAILDILTLLNDPEYEDDEKWISTLMIFYEDFDSISPDDYPEALKKCFEFIDMGAEKKEDDRPNIRIMDWEQDAGLIIPAVNRVLGREIRMDKDLHWWTFLGAYNEIGECAYSTVVSIRYKKAHGKKLEKWERDYIRDNKAIFELKRKLTQEEQEEEEAERQLLEELFG